MRIRAEAPPDTASLESKLVAFQAAVATRPTAFEGGAGSAGGLVRDLLAALARSDTARILGMAISRPEYAYLVYPESPLMHPPYRQDVGIAWMLHVAAHAKGLTRLLRRLGGRNLRYLGHRCGRGPEREGGNRIWRDCMVRFTVEGDTVQLALFSGIIARHGQFKVLNFSNDF